MRSAIFDTNIFSVKNFYLAKELCMIDSKYFLFKAKGLDKAWTKILILQ